MKKAFTLLELLIGVTIFIFLLIALQAFLGAIFSSTFRSLAMKRLADSTRTSLEIMEREMRLAQADPSSCNGIGSESFKIQDSGHTIRFKDFNGRCVIYSLQGNILQKGINNETSCGGNSCQDFLGGDSAEVNVEDVTFTKDASSKQPRILIQMHVSTNDPSHTGQSLDIDLQTTVSQREI